MQLKHAAHPQDTVDLLMPGNEGVLQSDWRAKYAAVDSIGQCNAF
jgi:hypothetical protein